MVFRKDVRIHKIYSHLLLDPTVSTSTGMICGKELVEPEVGPDRVFVSDPAELAKIWSCPAGTVPAPR
jgi:hypothetical protein